MNDCLQFAIPFTVGQSLCMILNSKMHLDAARIDFEQVAVMKMHGMCLSNFLKTILSSWSKSSLKDCAKWCDRWSSFITTKQISSFLCRNARNCLPWPLRNWGDARMTTALCGCRTSRWRFSLTTSVHQHLSIHPCEKLLSFYQEFPKPFASDPHQELG